MLIEGLEAGTIGTVRPFRIDDDGAVLITLARAGDKLFCKLHDNFSGLVYHAFSLGGYMHTYPSIP